LWDTGVKKKSQPLGPSQKLPTIELERKCGQMVGEGKGSYWVARKRGEVTY